MLKRNSIILSKKLYQLTFGGGVAFWAANFAISRTPIAAEYRAALSISYFPMLLEVFAWWLDYRILRQLFPGSFL